MPVWGSAQDGDGTASTAGTPATASIVFTGAPSTGSIAVCGVSLSPTWGASATTAADALATAINASTTTITGPASFNRLSQLRNHIYARGPSTGAAAGTCEIMTRQASAAHAGLTAITHTLNNVSSGGTITFSGGTGGCWGYLFNPTVTAWKSAVAVGGYGIWAAALPYCGALDAGDVVKVRSGKTITLVTNTNVTVAPAAMGSATAPVRFDIDDGTTWPADGSTPVLTIAQVISSNTSITFSPASTFSAATTCFAHFNAKKYPSVGRSLVFTQSGTGSSLQTMYVVVGGAVIYENIDLLAATGSTSGGRFTCTQGATSQVGTVVKGCRVVWQTQSASGFGYVYHGGTNSPVRAQFINCEFNQVSPASAQTPVLSLPSGGSSYRLEFIGCVFTGFVAGSRLITLGANPAGNTTSFTDCDFGNITIRDAISTYNSGSHTFDGNYYSSKLVTATCKRDFFIDTRAGFAEWNYMRGFPTAGARLLDGTTPWSIYASPTNQAAQISKICPFELPRIQKMNTLATATRTVTVQFALESTLTWTTADISVLVGYIDSTGAQVYVDSFTTTGAALTTSSATWSTSSFGSGQTFDPKEFAVSCPDMATDTEVTCLVRMHTYVANNTLGLFLNPELVIA